jgi:hypothetical protein
VRNEFIPETILKGASEEQPLAGGKEFITILTISEPYKSKADQFPVPE